IVLRLDDWLLEGLARSTTDVEGPHRQLRSRLANRLCGDDSNRFAELHELPGRQVTAVTMRADSAAAFTSEHRTNLKLLDADALQFGRNLFIDRLVRLDDLLLRHGIDHGFTTDATDDSSREVNLFFVPFVDRTNCDAVHCAAINFVDDHVLRRVDQFSR